MDGPVLFPESEPLSSDPVLDCCLSACFVARAVLDPHPYPYFRQTYMTTLVTVGDPNTNEIQYRTHCPKFK